jgi:gamma-glutamyltranspeptidase/glutathione hydrolase
MKARSAAIANDPVADEAAQEYLLSGGSAVGAVLSGFFAAAGAHSGVLLAPVSMLIAGVGAGARAFDGRLRQPGRGTKRPRGFKSGEEIPNAARVAVPAGVGALLVAHAYDASQRLSSIMKAGISRAERTGAEGRGDLLRRVRAVGAGAMAEAAFVRPMLRVAGPSQGGLVTPSDFGAVNDIDQPAGERKVGGLTLSEPPWALEWEGDAQELGIGCAVCAVDVRGVFAALSYRRVVDGLVIDELDLEAPLIAVPVRRGVKRVAPAAPLPAPAPIAIVRDASGAPSEVIAAPTAPQLDETALSGRLLRLRRSPATQEVQIVRA